MEAFSKIKEFWIREDGPVVFAAIPIVTLFILLFDIARGVP